MSTLQETRNKATFRRPGLNREMMDTLMPPFTPSGVRLRRVARRTFEEALMRVASGEQVHPTVTSFFAHHKGPPVVSVPSPISLRRTPCSCGAQRTAAPRSGRFARAAADVLAAAQTSKSADVGASAVS